MRAQVISQNEITMLLRSRKGYSVENNCSVILHPFLTIVCRMTMFRSLMPTEESCRHFPLLPFPIYFKTRIPLFQSHLPFLDISIITHIFSLIINLIITVSFSWLLRYSPSHMQIIFLKACHLHVSCIKYYWISDFSAKVCKV